MFNSGNYSYLLTYDIQSYNDKGLIDDKLGGGLEISKEAANHLRLRLIDIMRNTEETNKKREVSHELQLTTICRLFRVNLNT